MNVHHLELFFYVARHGGVSAAARHMPYGIQQPAISAQILQLEDALGVTLFVRRPFQLTKEGQSLYDFIAPFFGGLDDMGQRLRGGGERGFVPIRPRLGFGEIGRRLRETGERQQGETEQQRRAGHGRASGGAIRSSLPSFSSVST